MFKSPVYVVTLVLVSLTALSDLWWVSIDFGSRIGLIQGGVGSFDAESFTASLSIWNDLAFYSHVITAIIAVWMLLARHPWLIPVYIFSITTSMIDLALLAQNPLFEAGLMTSLVLGAHMLALAGMAWMSRTGVLRAQSWPDRS